MSWVYDFSARVVYILDVTLICLSRGYKIRALDPITMYTLITVLYSFVSRHCWLFVLLISFFAVFKIFFMQEL